MNDLQQKYKTYKTPFEESAFEHFKTIQQKGKGGQRIKSWHIIAVVLLLSIPVAFYISSLISSTDIEIQDVSLASNEKENQDEMLKTSNTNETSKYENEINTKEEKSDVSNNILTKKISKKTTSKVIKTQKETNNTPTIRKENTVDSVHNYLASTNQHFITQNNHKNLDKTDIISSQNPTITQQKNLDIYKSKNNHHKLQAEESFTHSIPSEMRLLEQTNTQNSELLPILNPVSPTPTKIWNRYSNHLKLSYNYVRFYPESNLLGLIPGYKTPSYFIQGEYFRELNKIISLGSSVGYARGVAPNTQLQDSLGYKSVTFAHLNLYLFLVNNKKHQLYLKAGSGITKTKRQFLSTDTTNAILISERTNAGALMGFSYNYHFTDGWFMSANIGKIWYEDTPYLGLSLGYAF